MLLPSCRPCLLLLVVLSLQSLGMLHGRLLRLSNLSGMRVRLLLCRLDRSTWSAKRGSGLRMRSDLMRRDGRVGVLL